MYLLLPANEVWGKVIFLHLFVILFTVGGLPQCMLGCHPHPPGLGTPLPRDQPHPPGPGTPPGPCTPRDQTHTPHPHPPGNRHPPGPGTPPPETREIRSTRGRYASHWNAILFSQSFRVKLCWHPLVELDVNRKNIKLTSYGTHD